MKVGTKSVLFGVHQFLIHPFVVAYAWFKLYGFPFDPRLWIAFFVHDLGYLGKADMDGPNGERHVEWGAWVMGALFGRKWHDFCLYHSRFYAKKNDASISRLCVADKLSIVIIPSRLYLLLGDASGETTEYMEAVEGKYRHENLSNQSKVEWLESIKDYLIKWVEAHKENMNDTWTKV